MAPRAALLAAHAMAAVAIAAAGPVPGENLPTSGRSGDGE